MIFLWLIGIILKLHLKTVPEDEVINPSQNKNKNHKDFVPTWWHHVLKVKAVPDCFQILF